MMDIKRKLKQIIDEADIYINSEVWAVDYYNRLYKGLEKSKVFTILLDDPQGGVLGVELK